MRGQLCFVVFVLSFTAAHGQQKDNQDASFEWLTYEDMKKLNGTWEINVNQKTGWSGTICLHITVYGPGAEDNADGYLFMSYDAKLIGKEKTITVRNAAGRGVTFAGIRQGNVQSLVTQPKGKSRFKPFEVKLVPELMAPFKLNGKKLTLDMSKSAKLFLPRKIGALNLDWSNSEWTRSDKVRIRTDK
jgi:hypothetical protein